MRHLEDTIKLELAAFYQQHPSAYAILFDKITAYNYLDYAADKESFEIFKERLKDDYFNTAITDYRSSENTAFKEEILTLAENQFDDPFRRLIMLRCENAFHKVLAHATAFLKGSHFLKEHNLPITDQSLFAMRDAYYFPAFKESAIRFFNSAFNDILTHAKEYNPVDQEPEPETLLSLAQAIASFNDDEREQFAKQIFEIFTYSCTENKSYAMKQASGFIAIRLTDFTTKFDIQVIDNAIKQSEKKGIEDIYIEQYLYAKWILTKNTKDPLAHIQKNKNPTFAIFALTELNYKKALPLFIEKQHVEKNPILWNIYNDAIVRLETDYWSSSPMATMVWHNGNRTPNQLAQGAKSDNEYQ